jgi:O-antigen/teichoic acid export membrane protein
VVKRRDLLSNSLGIIAATVASSTLGYVFWLLVARSCSETTVGVATAVVGAMMLTSVVASFGSGPSLIQRLPSITQTSRWSATLNSALLLGATGSFVGGAITALVVPAFVGGLGVLSDTPGHVLLFALGTSVWTVVSNLDSAFIAERAGGAMLTRTLSFGLLRLPLVPLVTTTAGASALAVYGIWAASALMSAALAVLVLRPRVRTGYDVRRFGPMSELARASRIFLGNHLITLGNVLPFSLLPMLVVAQVSAKASAHFYITWMLGGGFFMISSAVGSALFAEGGHRPHELREASVRAAQIVLVLLVPVMVVFLVGGRWILGLFGASYAEHGHGLLVLLTLSAIPDAITNIYIAMIRAQRRLRSAAAVNLTMALMTLGGSWYALPHLGITGVGWAWIGAQTAGSAFVLFDILRHRP